MREGSFRESCACLSEGAVFRWLALEKAVFGTRVLVGDKPQLVFLWLALAKRMYQTDYVCRTCLCYSQTAAGALKVLFLCFGVPVLSFGSWSSSVYLSYVVSFWDISFPGCARPLFDIVFVAFNLICLFVSLHSLSRGRFSGVVC